MRKDTSQIEPHLKAKNSKSKNKAAHLEPDDVYYIDEEQEAQLMRQSSNRSFRAPTKYMSNLAPLSMQPADNMVPMYSDGPYFGNPQQPMMFVPFTNQTGQYPYMPVHPQDELQPKMKKQKSV